MTKNRQGKSKVMVFPVKINKREQRLQEIPWDNLIPELFWAS